MENKFIKNVFACLLFIYVYYDIGFTKTLYCQYKYLDYLYVYKKNSQSMPVFFFKFSCFKKLLFKTKIKIGINKNLLPKQK